MKRWPEEAPSISAASITSLLRVESAAITRTIVKGSCVHTCATATETKARLGSLSQGIELWIKSSFRRRVLITPQLGWNTHVHRTALIAPGKTQGRSTIERRTVTPGNLRLRNKAVAVPITTTSGAEHKVKSNEFFRATPKYSPITTVR